MLVKLLDRLLYVLFPSYREMWRHHIYRVHTIRQTGVDPNFDWSRLLAPYLVHEYKESSELLVAVAKEANTLDEAVKVTWDLWLTGKLRWLQ